MSETLFLERVQKTFFMLENSIDQWNIKHDLVIDINKDANVFEVEFENTKKIILNSQAPMLQLWMASELGAYHFSFDDEKGTWEDTRGSGSFLVIFEDASKKLTGINFVI